MTRGTKEQHTQKLESVLTKLENESYQASKKKSKVYQKESVWLGHTMSQDGIRPNKEKNQQIEPTDKYKNPKIIFGSTTIFCEIDTKSVRKDGQYETTTEKRSKMGVDRRTKHRLQ